MSRVRSVSGIGVRIVSPTTIALTACLTGLTGLAVMSGGAAVAQTPDSPAPPAPSSNPQSPSSLADGIKRVQRLCSQRRFQDAASLAESLTRDHRDEVDAWMTLASIHLSSDWAMRRDARAESAATRALKIAGRRPDVLTALALAKQHQAKHTEALAIIAELVDCTPPAVEKDSLVDLLAVRAEMLLKMHALEPEARASAVRDLDRAILLTPTEAQPRILRGEALLQDGKTAEALADLEVALNASPGNKQVHRLLQTCLTRVGRRDEARRHYEIWQRLNRLTDSIATASSPKPEDVRQILRELKQLNPADLSRRCDLARYELELGAPDAAIAECDELLLLAPGWPPPAYLRSEALKAKENGPRPAVAGVGDK